MDHNFDCRHKPHSAPVPPCPTTHHFPIELYSEIFLYMVEADPRSRTELMLVCRHWHDILLSTPGIRSQLKIHRETEKKHVERLGRGWLLDVIVDIEHVPSDLYRVTEPVFDPVEFHASFMAAAEAAPRWRSLALLSLPPPGGYKGLKIIHPLQHLESFKIASSCNLGNFLKPLVNAITTTITPCFTVMEVFQSDAALYLLQLAHFQIFSSLTTLRLICRRMQNPVDVLPSLHKLEIFEAHHLFLPNYPPGVDLPLTQTLRVLHLKCVSVQWMTGQMFPALEECSITFPHHGDAIQSVYMPSCSILKYDSNNLGALNHFHVSHLDKVEIKCRQWGTWGGTLHLAALHPIFAAKGLTCLHMEIRCSERLLAYMLRLAPALEELWMVLSSPHALSSGFFLEIAAGGHDANASPSGQAIVSLCRKLRVLHLHYKRWLRGPERTALLSTFGAIVASRPPAEQIFSLQFSFDECQKLQEWKVLEPVERFDIGSTSTKTFIGVSGPYGIVPLSRAVVGSDDPLTEPEFLPLPRESEYITTGVSMERPIDFFFSFHNLKEVRMTHLSLEMEPDTHLPLNAPLFRTLKVLNVSSIPSSFLAGQTFHKLEKYKEEWIYDEQISAQCPLTEMPACTRLVLPLRRLATLKLPQVRELDVRIDGEHSRIWKEIIAVNSNLSGLTLLHLRFAYRAWPTIVIPKILGLLPALETLITNYPCFLASFGHFFDALVPRVHFFDALVPMNALERSGLNQSTWEGHRFEVLCPRLERLHIEGICPTEQAGLMPVLQEIVTLRAITWSPLKSFTFYHLRAIGEQSRMWQLIGKDKGFMMKEVIPAKSFHLDI